MQLKSKVQKYITLGVGLMAFATLTLVGCGGGGSSAGGSSTSTGLTPTEIAAITPIQIAAYSDAQIAALDVNIKYLSNAALGALSPSMNLGGNLVGQIQMITPAGISALTPAQVRMIGSTGAGGVTTTSKISYLNSGAWSALVADAVQVAAITAAEMATLTDSEVKAIDVKFGSLSNAALGALSPTTNLAGNLVGQIQIITPVEIFALTPAQISVIAGINANTGISFLNAVAFGSLSATQIAILTVTQKASLSVAQHTACAC